MHDDIYQMYLEEVAAITPCTPEEERELLAKVRQGDEAARNRLMEGRLGSVIELVKPYADQGLPMGDLIQEANIALLMAISQYEGGDFEMLFKEHAEAGLKAALEAQKSELQLEEEMLARVNVLQKVSQRMAEDLGREATVEELAEKMKMTPAEIKDIMKLTLDAMSVSPDAEV